MWGQHAHGGLLASETFPLTRIRGSMKFLLEFHIGHVLAGVQEPLEISACQDLLVALLAQALSKQNHDEPGLGGSRPSGSRDRKHGGRRPKGTLDSEEQPHRYGHGMA